MQLPVIWSLMSAFSKQLDTWNRLWCTPYKFIVCTLLCYGSVWEMGHEFNSFCCGVPGTHTAHTAHTIFVQYGTSFYFGNAYRTGRLKFFKYLFL